MHLSSYHAAPVDPLRVAQAEARAAQAACRRAEQQLDEMKDAYRQAGDREHVLETKVRKLEGTINCCLDLIAEDGMWVMSIPSLLRSAVKRDG